jgi:hypothetical protein
LLMPCILTPKYVNPLLLLYILTLEYVEPLVDPMHAYSKHVCSLDHLYYHPLSGMMASIMPLLSLSSYMKL